MMHLVRLTFAALWIVCGLAPASQAQPPKPLPRIAIVPASEDRDVSSFADLLTAAMSQDAKGYELIERAELNRITQEAEVQAMSAAERPRALARLAKADGLIVLATDPSGPGHRTISARLSSTASGLIVKTFVLAADDADLPTSAKLASDALRFAAARLGRAGGEPAQVVSLLGIRANSSNSPGIAIETALNAAITHHLSGIPGLAVVERWKLDDVAFERSLSEKDLPALTTGTLLVDGSLDVREKVATVKVRIRKTQDEAGKTLAIEGPADDALLLAKNIATKVAAECGNNTEPRSLDPRAEAAAYAKLGGWLLNHRMGPEAAQAYESAVALGDNSSETLYKRIYAYADAARDVSSARFDERSAFQSYCYELEANSQSFPFVLASVNRATAYAETLLQAPWKPYVGCRWAAEFRYSSQLAMMACHTLVAAYRLNLHVNHSAEIEVLRRRTEFLVKLHRKEREMNADSTKYGLDVLSGYWSATPEQATDYWMNLLGKGDNLTPSQLRGIRSGIANAINVEGLGLKRTTKSGIVTESQRPLFVDWRAQDNGRAEASWRMLLNKLRSSKLLFNQNDGIALALRTTPWGKDHDKLLLDMLDLFENNRETLKQPEGRNMFFSFSVPFEPYGYPAGFAERYTSLLELVFASSDELDLAAILFARSTFERFTDKIRRKTPDVTKEAVEKLLLAVKGYAGRVDAKRGLKSGFMLHDTELEGFLAALANAYPILPKSPLSQPRLNAGDGGTIPVGMITVAKATAPKDQRYWVNLGSVDSGDVRLLASRWRSREFGFVAIDQNLKIFEIPPVPESLCPAHSDTPFAPAQVLLAKTAGFLSMTWKGRFLGYDYQSRNWSDESSLLPTHLRNAYEKKQAAGSGAPSHRTRPTVGMINDTLYVATANDGHTIGHMVHGHYELIASSRRRPAEHPVDELPPASVRAMFPGAKGRPYALLAMPDRSEVHDLEQGKRVGTFMAQVEISFQGRIAVISNDYMVATIDPGSEKPNCLMRNPNSSELGDRTIQDDLPRQTTWRWPSILAGNRSRPILRGDCLFFMKFVRAPNDQVGAGFTSRSADKLILLCFKPELREPLEIPLTVHPEALTRFFDASSSKNQPVINVRGLQSTTAGMFFTFDMAIPTISPSIFPPSPGILYITWKQVDEWLVRHGHAPMCSEGTPAAVKPVR